ncbi:hypothetical protein cyc_04553 [Cyclospora cayetanensis]|uniref:Uncharacterized protein n=1 Tax=Cyclospora cayetanensis TaxID=88456 RepID=A0A1D3CXR0_9EIME|nr:hypothetical protein cyc_04553 [Cyclospora cayetanensis]
MGLSARNRGIRALSVRGALDILTFLALFATLFTITEAADSNGAAALAPEDHQVLPESSSTGTGISDVPLSESEEKSSVAAARQSSTSPLEPAHSSIQASMDAQNKVFGRIEGTEEDKRATLQTLEVSEVQERLVVEQQLVSAWTSHLHEMGAMGVITQLPADKTKRADEFLSHGFHPYALIEAQTGAPEAPSENDANARGDSEALLRDSSLSEDQEATAGKPGIAVNDTEGPSGQVEEALKADFSAVTKVAEVTETTASLKALSSTAAESASKSGVEAEKSVKTPLEASTEAKDASNSGVSADDQELSKTPSSSSTEAESASKSGVFVEENGLRDTSGPSTEAESASKGSLTARKDDATRKNDEAVYKSTLIQWKVPVPYNAGPSSYTLARSAELGSKLLPEVLAEISDPNLREEPEAITVIRASEADASLLDAANAFVAKSCEGAVDCSPSLLGSDTLSFVATTKGDPPRIFGVATATILTDGSCIARTLLLATALRDAALLEHESSMTAFIPVSSMDCWQSFHAAGFHITWAGQGAYAMSCDVLSEPNANYANFLQWQHLEYKLSYYNSILSRTAGSAVPITTPKKAKEYSFLYYTTQMASSVSEERHLSLAEVGGMPTTAREPIVTGGPQLLTAVSRWATDARVAMLAVWFIVILFMDLRRRRMFADDSLAVHPPAVHFRPRSTEWLWQDAPPPAEDEKSVELDDFSILTQDSSTSAQ